MAREITLWLARDADGEVCLFAKNPTWDVFAKLWNTLDSRDYVIVSEEQAQRIYGCNIQPCEKIKLGPMPVGRRQKAKEARDG